MMPVSLAPEPPSFDADVRVPGLRSIYEKCGVAVPDTYKRTGGSAFARVYVEELKADGTKHKRAVTAPEELPGSAFRDYWTEALQDLFDAYSRTCSFCCFRIHPTATPTVDHMVPKSLAWDQVYEWSNYRLAALLMNARKRELLTIIDPFDVEPGWFAIELTFGQVVPGPAADGDAALKARLQDTIIRLGLNDFASERLRDIEAYEAGDVSLRRLKEESPFVAFELERQERLHQGDQP